MGPPLSLHKSYKHVEAAAREINKVREEKIKALSRKTEPSSFRTTSLRDVKCCIAISVDMMSTGNMFKDHMRSLVCVKKKKRELDGSRTLSGQKKEVH